MKKIRQNFRSESGGEDRAGAAEGEEGGAQGRRQLKKKPLWAMPGIHYSPRSLFNGYFFIPLKNECRNIIQFLAEKKWVNELCNWQFFISVF